MTDTKGSDQLFFRLLTFPDYDEKEGIGLQEYANLFVIQYSFFLTHQMFKVF